MEIYIPFPGFIMFNTNSLCITGPRAQSSFFLSSKVNGLVYLNSQLSQARATHSEGIKACDNVLILLGHIIAIALAIRMTD